MQNPGSDAGVFSLRYGRLSKVERAHSYKKKILPRTAA
jgi:hypothetical protein